MNIETLFPSLGVVSPPILAATFAIANGNPETCVLIGASFATAILLIKGKEEKMSFSKLSTRAIISLFLGTTAPSLLHDSGWLVQLSFGFLTEGQELKWSAWAIAGLLCGLSSEAALDLFFKFRDNFFKSKTNNLP